ncbi:MAG TPA: hypothetical protein DCZ01_04215 [Elusimicrobia bacterium]|nr:MAG: hypothetical protein A2X37_12310 [Elusimicrobia bacterium GWA2_66_18]OGR73649.1 MAG: hypothetical protein A2X40_07910 [Elusimicrobia bacterium GWC2_65_9]HAZ07729.1 hypothetical protein [Elusimicrobiota bacterium]
MRLAVDAAPLLDAVSGLGFYCERICAALAEIPELELIMTISSWRSAEGLERAPLPRGPRVRLLPLRAPQRLLLPAEEALGLRWRERRLLEAGADAYLGLGNVLPPLTRLPGVVVVHHVGSDTLPPGLWPRFYFRTLTDRSVARARRVIAVSERTRADVLAKWRLEPARVTMVHEGGPDVSFRPARPGDQPPSVDGPYLLHVGALVARKNVPLLLRAFGRLVERNPSLPHRLVLAGRDGDASAEVARLCAGVPLAERVLRLGAVPRATLVALYQGASVAAVPSRLEGFGFPVLEAMACGTPVVVSTAGSLPEIAGDAALTHDPDDEQGLGVALERLLGDPALAAELRRKGLERAAAFSWRRAAAETLAVVRGAVASAKI